MMTTTDKFKQQDFESKWPRTNLTSSRGLRPRSRGAAIRGKQAYNPSLIEGKWQQYWERMGVYQPDLRDSKKPFYNLMMFPYPSAEGLHVGNVYAFTGADIYGRFKRMQGFDVFEPIGLDGFGIHSENYALKIGKHPAVQAKISQKKFYRQLHAIGNGFAWKNTLETYDPQYYRWTQWLFVQMFKHGLACRKKSPVNFCPSCKTVLSDEQVVKKIKNQRSKIKDSLKDTSEVARRVYPVRNSSDGGEISKKMEESIDACERCGSSVEKRNLEQWFFKITAYAEKLLQNTYKPSFKWTEKVKIGQRNWIGKKEGIIIKYQISNIKYQIECFTTRPDTNFGATFVVIAPEHPLVSLLLDNKFNSESHQDTSGVARRDSPDGGGIKKAIREYIEKSKKKSETERIAEGRGKTGVFTGYYCINQLNNYKMPVYISDFVLGHVGTGAVVGVPGHDKRDFEFAQEFNIPVIRVVIGSDGDKSPITRREQVQEEEGTMINSGFLNGMDIRKAISAMMDYIEEKGWGKRVVTYKLRDWCISRQRYWGAPIPMIFCQSCADKGISYSISEYSENSENRKVRKSDYQKIRNSEVSDSLKFRLSESSEFSERMPGWFPVPEEELPVLLPQNVKDWQPEGTGKGPLAKIDSFVKVACPQCRGPARRETDVCDTFLDSSWYFLRYPSVSHLSNLSDLSDLPWDPEITHRWLPVTQYIGGAEHTVLHLLYARFVTMALHDMGYLDFEEPFSRFYAHGLIIAEGAKMSKSRGNIIIPDEYIDKYGADTLRTYLMFLGPFDMGGDFRDTGIAGMYRFLGRVWRLVSDVILVNPAKRDASRIPGGSWTSQDDRLTRIMHRTIKEVTQDLENLCYNTAIAHIMEYVNEIQNSKFKIQNEQGKEIIKTLLLLLAPFAPHMTEELLQKLKAQSSNVKSDQLDQFDSIHKSPWPNYDQKYLIEDEVTIVVQVNGKTRDVIKVAVRYLGEEAVAKIAQKSPKVQKYLSGKTIKKAIFVPGKLINFVVI